MIEFAVTVEGLEKARWVFAVEGDRLLVAHDDQTLHWHPLSECQFVKALTPDVPRTVLMVQPVSPQLAVPNRAMRRANGL